MSKWQVKWIFVGFRTILGEALVPRLNRGLNIILLKHSGLRAHCDENIS